MEDMAGNSAHVIVWDIETVPDVAQFALANGFVGKPDEEIREAMGEKFPKHIYHSIICIGALVARFEDRSWGGSTVAPLKSCHGFRVVVRGAVALLRTFWRRF